MSSILFAKHVSFEHSVSSPRPVITSRREKNNNNKAKVFQPPIDSQSASCSLISRHVLSARAVGARPRCSEFLSNRKYRYCSYTQTDDTHCWPCKTMKKVRKPMGSNTDMTVLSRWRFVIKVSSSAALSIAALSANTKQSSLGFQQTTSVRSVPLLRSMSPLARRCSRIACRTRRELEIQFRISKPPCSWM